MRLIDADELFNWGDKKLKDAVKYGNKSSEQQDWSYSTLMMYEIADEIFDAPTIDAVPVKHGKWIYNDEWWEFICTSCHRGIGNIKEYKYCPNCGARMDKGEMKK